MKINRMWAGFSKKVYLYPSTIRFTRRDAIKETQKYFGTNWSTLQKQFGYRAEKVVVLRADEFKAEIKTAEDKRGKEVLEMVRSTLINPKTCGDLRVFPHIMKRAVELVDQTYKERYGPDTA